MTRVTRQDFQKLLEFRVALREFQRWQDPSWKRETLSMR